MNAHPLTLFFLEKVAKRPGMFMSERCDLRALELQLYGYELALIDAGVFGEHDSFNLTLNEYVREHVGLACAQGWAETLMTHHGPCERAFEEFWALFKAATSQE